MTAPHHDPDQAPENPLRFPESSDPEAFRQLVESHGGALLSFFRRRQELEVAKDLAQETLLRVYKTRASFRGDASLKTWLLRIATNVEKNHVRDAHAGKRRGIVVPIDAPKSDEDGGPSALELQDLTEDPYASAIQNEDRRLLLEALGKLPPKERLCIQKCYLQERSIREVAEHQGVSESTVKSQLQTGKRRLRSLLRSLGASRQGGVTDG